MINYLLIFIFLLISTLFYISINTSKKNNYNNKVTTYECGFNTILKDKGKPYNIHFFSVGLIFTLFELEFLLLIPLLIIGGLVNIKFIISYLLIIIFIIGGLFFEWHYNMLEW
uniref:NADH dehydrogenase subunit 3 n=1 Tax=Gymnopraia lapislazula TaxID=316224 RepID=UPI0026E320AF|nr:NADH dehydrogenase subunit 3 [Gymnopraia lapislazula]WJJ70122.1 NADH dehydrogenase subunit 3 [Gymnopraia lapislazula]